MKIIPGGIRCRFLTGKRSIYVEFSNCRDFLQDELSDVTKLEHCPLSSPETPVSFGHVVGETNGGYRSLCVWSISPDSETFNLEVLRSFPTSPTK